ncbi:MAG: cupredoxin domain-containing protein [Candidatus Nanoarchaeia archaeon]
MKQLLSFLLLALVLITACETTPTPQPFVSPPQVEKPVQPPTSIEPTSPPTQPSSTSTVKEFTIRAFQYGFEPNLIEVKKGDKVIIHAFSSDTTHGFNIPIYNVNLVLDGPEKKTVEFIADKHGSFHFRCSIPCGHGHSGMQGTLVVRE